MKKRNKLLMGISVFIILFVSFFTINRHKIPQLVFSVMVGTKAWGLVERDNIQLDSNVKWLDDYYTIRYIDEKTIAIGEPRYYQENVNYLILGDKQALLLDTGPGLRNIKPVVENLTSLPITLINTHFHFDHLGSTEKFNDIKLTENQVKNQTIKNQTLIPSKDSFIGHLEGFSPPEIRFNEILNEGATIDLGNRKLEVIFAPGHSSDSTMLYDKESNQLFTGDFIYKGLLMMAFIPGTSMEEYLASTKKVIEKTNSDTILIGSHTRDPNDSTLSQKNLIDLKTFLENKKSGVLPKKEKINTDMEIIY
ncbi:MBL fold metallo-hydrolase [Metabacillus fastidiosus]|uniref:MBL fold metallo-hydrolase n=1 Tax=Metabacillus fastidiosus TaxID=1458 RepID=UPI002DB6C5A0|nr:MBL fold metallo-hydrolase [Metabacillus fastidiosus]MEC2074822.1 MBL fold metallo-hydrolase [Metabacillus fastidiosus]